MTAGEVGLLALVGGLLALDRTAAAQFGLSQPIAAGPLVGWLLGDAPGGLLVGGLLQLLYAGALPIGASVPPDEGAATLVAAATAVVGARLDPVEPRAPALLAIAVLAGLATGEVARGLDIWVRRTNAWFAHWADAAADRADDRAIARLALGGLGLWFVVGAGTALAFAPTAALVGGWAVAALPADGAAALGLLALALPVLAIASALTAMRAPARLALFVGAFVVGSVAVGLAGIGARP
jgi:mannose/fructose/N-acetylgalactosamine-specific phosphotransferase system component IIC